jgi:fatty acid-binding protein DegV
LKPILFVQDGRVDALERVRTRRKSMERLVEIVVERCAGKAAVRLAVVDANAPAEAKEVMENAASQLNVTEKIFAPLSPVVGTHTGPGTIGLVYMTEV